MQHSYVNQHVFIYFSNRLTDIRCRSSFASVRMLNTWYICEHSWYIHDSYMMHSFEAWTKTTLSFARCSVSFHFVQNKKNLKKNLFESFSFKLQRNASRIYHVCIMNALEMYHGCNILKERPWAIFIDLSWKLKENILYCHNLYLKCIMNVSCPYHVTFDAWTKRLYWA